MGNVHMEATQINYRGGSKKMSVEEAIKAAGTEITPEEKTWIDSIPALTSSNAGKTDQDVIAPEFDAEAGVYAVGDKVMYDGKLYEFTTAHETPGDWDSSEVSETTVADELNSLESGLTVDVLLEPTLATGTSTVHQLAGDIGNYKLLLVTLGADVSRTQASNVIVMANTRQYYNVSYQTIDTRFSFGTTTSISIEGQWYVAVYGVLK